MNRSKTLFGFLSALTFASLFIALGIWQLDRAGEVRELQKPYQELPVIDLSKIAKPDTNLAGESVNRIVKFSGQYVGQLFAPNQVDSAGKISTWLVGIFKVDGGGEILVVRSDKRANMPEGNVEVEGRIFHRQFEDKSSAENSEAFSTIRRIDPALVISQFGGDFYDGFIVARSELSNGAAIEIPRVALAPARPTTPGYYWQHIAYVLIWWVMALVVLFMPIYSKRRKV